MTAQPVQPFWNWSLATYSQPGVKELCLTLQDAHLQNVNVCLWCVWAPQSGWADLGDDQVISILDSTSDLADYGIDRLREVRRYFSSPKPYGAQDRLTAIKQQILAVELDLEHLAQDTLAEATQRLGGAPTPGPSPSGQQEAARRYFTLSDNHLEKPRRLVNDRDRRHTHGLFDQLWTLSSKEIDR